MGCFITAYARDYTIRTAQKCFDRICYCDTDSIHLSGTEIPSVIKDIIDKDRLGYWQHESTFSRAKFVRQKTYLEVVDDKLHVKCAGMPDNLKKYVIWENFTEYNEQMLLPARDGYWFGKLMPKQVNGGVVLEETHFAIR
jgi:hypothetical protein